MSKEIRYELEVEGAKCYLAPLSFPVAEAALGFIFSASPRYLTAGGIVINSLFIKGSAKLKENGEHYDEACLQAYATVNSLSYVYKEGQITIPHQVKEKGKDGKEFYKPKDFKCKISEKVARETLENCLGLIMPNIGNPKPLTAGRALLLENWIEGDEEIKTNDELLIVACLACFFILKHKQGSIKKV
jgi:hypothetical protein